MPTTHTHLTRAALGLLTLASPALGADDKDARALMAEVVKAYKSLDSYADAGKFTSTFKVGGKAQKQESELAVAFARPNKLDLNAGVVRLVSDGKTLRTFIGPVQKYIDEPAPAKVDVESIRETSVGAMIYGGPNSLTLGVLLTLLTADDPAKSIMEGTNGLTQEPARQVAGASVTPLLIDQIDGPDIRMLVDDKTKLLAGIELVFTPEMLAKGAPKAAAVEVDRVGWDAGKVRTASLGPDTFAAKVPAGFTKVASLEEAFGKAADAEDPSQAMVGKPAPDFKAVALVGDQLKDLSKADLAGKVVLIDLWATWCGPCIRELPDVQQMVAAYDKAKANVRVICLSVDENPGDVADMRKLVEDKLKEIKFSLSGSTVGTVALDARGDIAKAFRAESIPMLVLMDEKGVVRSVHVGETERKVLEGEIDALLAGKPIGGKAKSKD